MAELDRLTRAFLEDHPGDAARVLERMPGSDSAAFLAGLPARLAAPVLTLMLPTAAGRILGELPDDKTIGFLAALGPQAAVGILRHQPEDRRARLIEALPTTTALASQLLLGYPEDSVGAWTDPEVLALAADLQAADALARIQETAQLRIDEVYVVGENDRLLGVVDVATIVRAPAASSLNSLAVRPVAVVPAASPLAGAAGHRGWQHASGLPVVERGERLVGVLRRAVLMRALARARSARVPSADQNLIGIAAAGYWKLLSGMLAAGVSILPSVGPVVPRADDNGAT